MDGMKRQHWSELTFKVFTDAGEHEFFRFPAPSGHRWYADGIERHKMEFAAHLRQAFPNRWFRFVKIRPNRYNVLPITEQSGQVISEA